MGDTHSAQIFSKNKAKDEGANKAKRPCAAKGKDKENGSCNQGMGKLLFDSESQKQDEGVRRTGAYKVTDRNMETMEETVDKKMEPSKAGHQSTKGV